MDPAHVLPWYFDMSDPYPSPAPSDVFHLPASGPARRRQPDAYTLYTPYDHPRHRSRPRSPDDFGPPRAASPALSTVSSDSRAGSHHGPPSSVSPVTSSTTQRSAPPRPPPPKHTKHRLRDVDRKNICLYHIDHPHARQEDIGAAFNVERSTISKILKEKARWLNISPEDESNEQTSRHRSSKFPEIEWDLRKTLQVWSEQGVNITDNLIRTRAMEIARDLRIGTERFKGSSGWVENFKMRHDIRRGEWPHAERFGPAARGGVAPRLIPPPGRSQTHNHTQGMDMDINYGHPQAQSHHHHHHPQQHHHHPHQQQQQQQWGGSPDSHDSSDASPIPGPASSHALVLDPALQPQSQLPPHIQPPPQGHAGSSPPMGTATAHAPPSSSAGTHTPVQTQLALDPSAIQHSPEGYDAHSHPHPHADYMHPHQQPPPHHAILDHHGQPIDMRPQEYVDGEKMIPLGVTGDPPPPTLQEAEDAMTTVLAWVDRCGPADFLLPNEREALTHVKCALFQHASGLPYVRQ